MSHFGFGFLAADPNTILEFGLLAWRLKVNGFVLLFILSLTANSLCKKMEEMKKEHDEYLFSRQLESKEERKNLAVFAQRKLQKPLRGSIFGNPSSRRM